MAVTLPSLPRARDLRAALPTSPPAPARERLLSLDVFRGLTIAGMLLVNDPGTWERDLSAARARGVERLDADRPHLPVLPLHRRRHDASVARRAPRARRRRGGDPRADHPARPADLPVRLPGQRLPLLHLGRRRRGRRSDVPPARRRPPATTGGSWACCSASASRTCGRAADAADDREASRSSSSPSLLFGYWFAMTVLPVPGRARWASCCSASRRARWRPGGIGCCSTGRASGSATTSG